jgi:hypothetical protein
MTGKPPGESLAPRTTDQNTHSGAKALINSSKSEAIRRLGLRLARSVTFWFACRLATLRL